MQLLTEDQAVEFIKANTPPDGRSFCKFPVKSGSGMVAGYAVYSVPADLVVVETPHV